MKKQHGKMPVCRLCHSGEMALVKKSDVTSTLGSGDFAITDSQYGKTLDLYRCAACGLLQSPDLADVGSYYEGLEDAEYERTRKERGIQARKILYGLKRYLPTGRLLDVGAGSGILVEQAIALGYSAVGIEPSVWLGNKAKERGLPVVQGVLPNKDIMDMYDVVTLIDVIEHVNDPVGLLRAIRERLGRDGLLILTTPDANSFFAKVLRWKWWHFRIAHISYFDLNTLALLLERAGFVLVEKKRPSWYFTFDYLFDRMKMYLPRFLRPRTPALFRKFIVPLNLFDSYEIICRVKK